MIYLIFLKIVLDAISNQDVIDSTSTSPEENNILWPQRVVSSFSTGTKSVILDIKGNKQVESLLRKINSRTLTSTRSLVQAMARNVFNEVNKNQFVFWFIRFLQKNHASDRNQGISKQPYINFKF